SRSLALALLLSCGGGGGKSTNQQGNPPPAGGEDRSAVLAAIESKLATFDGRDQDAENQQMLAYLQSRAEFSETGLSDGSTWGRFADGTTLVIANNLIVSPAATSGVHPLARPPSSPAATSGVHPLARPPSSPALFGPPRSLNVYLRGSVGAVF